VRRCGTQLYIHNSNAKTQCCQFQFKTGTLNWFNTFKFWSETEAAFLSSFSTGIPEHWQQQ
jgi:hypothetical protein